MHFQILLLLFIGPDHRSNLELISSSSTEIFKIFNLLCYKKFLAQYRDKQQKNILNNVFVLWIIFIHGCNKYLPPRSENKTLI